MRAIARIAATGEKASHAAAPRPQDANAIAASATSRPVRTRRNACRSSPSTTYARTATAHMNAAMAGRSAASVAMLPVAASAVTSSHHTEAPSHAGAEL